MAPHGVSNDSKRKCAQTNLSCEFRSGKHFAIIECDASISPNPQCLFRWPQNVRTNWWKTKFIATSKARNDVKWNPTVWNERILLVRIFCATFCVFIWNARKPATVIASRLGLIFNEIDNFRCRGTSCLFIIPFLCWSTSDCEHRA